MLKKIGDYLEIRNFGAETFSVPDPERGNCGEIKAFVETFTPVKVLYMASLELDGMEMHDSFRLSVEPGENTMPLPEMKVINPLLSSDDIRRVYTVTLKIYASGGVVHKFDSEISF